MRKELSPSQRMTAAWKKMTKNNFDLVHVYCVMDHQRVSEMIKNGNIHLPKGQEPIADYLKAVNNYLQSSAK